MEYFKVKIRGCKFNEEVWIGIRAYNLHEALRKVHKRCATSWKNFYPLDQTITEISEAEYMKLMNRPQMIWVSEITYNHYD